VGVNREFQDSGGLRGYGRESGKKQTMQEPRSRSGAEEIDVFQVLRAEANQLIGRARFKATAAIAAGLVGLVWLLSGVYAVGPGERGIVLTFGRLTGMTNPGLNYRIPWPVQSHMIVDVSQVRRAEVGFISTPNGVQPVPQEALMLTGDENIVHLELFVQYVIQDPVKYLFRMRDGSATLHNAAEVALRSAVGQHPIESTMTEGRVTVQTEVQNRLQRVLDALDSGIVVTEARLLTVDPPNEVREAFLEVVRAFEDRERLVREAEAYRERALPEARGEAARVVQEAEGYKASRIIRAQGEADRFMHQLDEYQRAPGVTRERLYLETIERALPSTERIIVDTGGVSPLFPLRPLISSENSTAAASASPAAPGAVPLAPSGGASTNAPRAVPTPTPVRR
jgi:membrane protease subunit HflK